MRPRQLIAVFAVVALLSGGPSLQPLPGSPLHRDALASTPGATPTHVSAPQALLPANWEEAAGETAHVNGVDIYYEVYGKGAPVILVGGGFGNLTYWRNQIAALSVAYQVVVMDTRGNGRSPYDGNPITYEALASDVLGLMDHLGLARATIVGWSDGAITALDIAIYHPERLDKAVAYGANYNSSGLRPDPSQTAKINAFFDQAVKDYQERSPQPERLDAFLAAMSHMWATEPNFTESQLKAITTPFLILDGAKEELIDLNQTRLMAQLIPGSELVIMPDTGHFAPFEQPAEFNRIVLDYLSGNATATPTS